MLPRKAQSVTFGPVDMVTPFESKEIEKKLFFFLSKKIWKSKNKIYLENISLKLGVLFIT